MEPARARVVGIDALRALAALAVFVCHLAQFWELGSLPLKLPQVLATGAHGVDLFIVLSGFVLGLPTLAAHGRLRTPAFIARRATRLLPAYYVALVLATLVAVSPIATWIVAERASAGDVAWHLTLLQTWSPDRLGSINGSLWSVALEAQLYLVFPLLLLAMRRWGWAPLVAASAVLSLALSGSDLPGALGAAITDERNLPVRLVQFVIGMACAWLVTHRRVPSRRMLWSWTVLTVCLALAASTADLRTGIALVWALPSAGLILLACGSLGERLAATPLERWGLASYSFYLLHQPIILVIGHVVRPHVVDDRVALGVGLALALPATALAAWVLHVCVERPSHLFGRRRFAMVAPGATPAGRPQG